MHRFEVYGIVFDDYCRNYEPAKLLATVSIPDDGDEECLIAALDKAIGQMNPREYGLGKQKVIEGVTYDVVLGPNNPVLLLRQLPQDSDTIGNAP